MGLETKFNNEITEPESNLDEVASYIKMSLNDVVIFNKDHFTAIYRAIEDNDDLTHIVTDIGFVSCNMDKEKLFNNKVLERNQDTMLDPYIYATVTAKIDRSQNTTELMACNVLLQIDTFIKQYIMLH